VWGQLIEFEKDTTKVIKATRFFPLFIIKLFFFPPLDRKRRSLMKKIVAIIQKVRAEEPTNYVKYMNAYRDANNQPFSDEMTAMLFNALFFAALTNTANGVLNVLLPSR